LTAERSGDQAPSAIQTQPIAEQQTKQHRARSRRPLTNT
jgi:hypothetical protein